MKERTHESPEPDFYAQLQESIWNGLEDGVKKQELPAQNEESHNPAPALSVSSDENQDVESTYSSLELEQQREHTEANGEYPSSTTEPAEFENPDLDFSTQQPEKLRTKLYEEDSDEHLSLREKLKERLFDKLHLEHILASLKDNPTVQKLGARKQKKRKLLTRMDIVFFILLILLGVGYVGTAGQGSQSKTPNNNPSSSTKSSHITGMGGIDVPATVSQATNATAACGVPDQLATFINQIKSSSGFNDLQTDLNPTDDWLTGTLTGCGKYVKGGAAFQTDIGTTATQPLDITAWQNVSKVWSGVDGIVSSILVILFMLAGYRVFGGALGFRYAEALEALPRVLLAAVAALLSLTLVDVIIQLNNGLCQFMLSIAYNSTNSPTDITTFVIPAQDWLTYFVAFLVANIVLFVAGILLSASFIGAIFGALIGAFGLIAYIATLREVMLTTLSIMLAVQLIMRFVMINVFIILSPLGIACWAFPNRSLQEVARSWCMGFFKMVFVQFIQVSCLAVGMVVIPPLSVNWNLTASLNGTNLFAFLGPIAIIWLMVRVPRMVGSSALGQVEAAGHVVGQAVGGFAAR